MIGLSLVSVYCMEMDLLSVAKNAANAQRQRARIKRAGRSWNGYPLWTARELEILRSHYPDFKALKKALPHRTKNALKWRAQNIGISTHHHQWTGSEISRLRKLWMHGASRDEIQHTFPTMEWSKIIAQIKEQHFLRPRPKLKPCGIAIVDEVRNKASALAISMRELDEMAGSRPRQYFLFCRSYRHPNWRCLVKAIEGLGGRLQIVWDDQ